MEKRILIILSLVLACFSTWAKNIIDLHGIKGERAQQVLKIYGPRIRDLETQIMRDVLSFSAGQSNLHHYQDLITQKTRLLAELKRRYHFGFVDFQSVYYPQDKTAYTTIEIIADANSERMRFLPQIIHQRPMDMLRHWVQASWVGRKPCQMQQDLITQMMQYENLTLQLMMTGQFDQGSHACPVYHCISSFDPPKLKPYLLRFNQGVIAEKQRIIRTLRTDPDPQRRASAAFLIGHIQDPNEIITLLIPSVTDPESAVRNNVLRVIGTTLYKSRITHLDAKPFIALLDSPYLTDRNKALNILLLIAENPAMKQQIMQASGQQIVELLQLAQPNNHDVAYSLLKKITYQRFGDQQFAQWRDWVRTHPSGMQG